MSKKNKDPYPITDVYHVTDTLVDAATVVVTDLCENLSNSIDTHCDDILEHLKKINTKKFNSISVGISADGISVICSLLPSILCNINIIRTINKNIFNHFLYLF